ncbi:MAG: rhamnan synthesis F family protein [Treponema sp.]|nr:rhamnan synthesis F family protein [Treponema sp.]
MKRCGIFRINTDTVYDYILYLLEKVSTYTDKLFILHNNDLTNEEYQKLANRFNNIQQCKESNFISCLQFVICNENNSVRLSEYDELLYFDDSFFGPFFDFSEMFKKFENTEIDFWGITKHPTHKTEKKEIINAYIQPYFMILKSSLIHGNDFLKFVQTYKEDKDIRDEAFTNYFENKGYKWDVYVPSSEYEARDIADNYDILKYSAFNIIKKHKCPVLSKSLFEDDKIQELHFNMGDQFQKAFDYIKEYTDYNTDYIITYMLKNCNISKMRQKLNLNYIVDSKSLKKHSVKMYKTAAVFAHVYYKDLIDDCFEYLSQVPAEIDIYLSVCDENAKIYAESKFGDLGRKNYKVMIAGKRGRDLGALLVAFRPFIKNYEYICFVHDKKTAGGKGCTSIGNTFFSMCWDNLLDSTGYIDNVLDLFFENDLLGFLAPPIPHHSFYIKNIGNTWTVCYPKTEELAKKLELDVEFSPDIQPFAVSTCFWCKTKALNKLFNYEFLFEDFPEEPLPLDGTLSHALERIFIYVAQHHGYYSATALNRKYAACSLMNFESLLAKIIKNSITSFGAQDITDIFSGFNYSRRISLLKFILKNESVCIYGQGVNGKNMAEFLEAQGLDFKYFLVSDSLGIERKYGKREAYYLSEKLDEKNSVGVIVAVDKRFCDDVENNLLNAGWDNYFIAT